MESLKEVAETVTQTWIEISQEHLRHHEAMHALLQKMNLAQTKLSVYCSMADLRRRGGGADEVQRQDVPVQRVDIP